MQQRQPRLGDILDDYCPRERRLTNHAVVAMVGDAVKLTRCTTCESEHEYKHAKVPRPRKKPEQSTLYSQVLAGVAPKHATLPPPADARAPELGGAAHADEPDLAEPSGEDTLSAWESDGADESAYALASDDVADSELDERDENDDLSDRQPAEEGPVHRQLIRAQLPRHEGQVPVARQAPDFTIRMPATGRANRFRPRQPRSGGQQFQGNRSGGQAAGGHAGSGHSRTAGGRPPGGRPHDRSRAGNRRGPGRNRPK